MSEIRGRDRWAWWHVLLIGLAMAAAIAACADAWRDIFEIADRDEEQSHTYLAPIIAVWMVWARRIRFRNLVPRGSVTGLMVIVLGALMCHFGYAHSFDIAWHGGAVVVLSGAVIAVTGRHFLFAFLSAFAVLAFMIPVPGQVRQMIAMPLQTWTAGATQAVLETLGVDVERTGNVLIVNNQLIAVAEACNGLRMVWALILVTYAFAFSIPLRPMVRGTLLVLSPFVALLCNIIRLVPTAALYGYADTNVANYFHDISGWVMLPVAFVGLLITIRLLRWALVPVGRFNLAYQ